MEHSKIITDEMTRADRTETLNRAMLAPDEYRLPSGIVIRKMRLLVFLAAGNLGNSILDALAAGKIEFTGTPEQWHAISEIVYILSLSREQAAEYLNLISRREQTCRYTAFALSLTEQDLIEAWTWFLNGDAAAIVAGQARSADADSSKNA